MTHDLTVGAVRMALNLQQLKGEITSWNIVNASAVDAPMFVIDQSRTDAVLQAVAESPSSAMAAGVTHPESPTLAIVHESYTAARPGLDELVAESVSAGLNYQALAESLGRHFGLMRLAITGRS